jgi:hypothetical protein
LRHLQRRKPQVYNVSLGPGELSPFHYFSLSHGGGVHTKDSTSRSSSPNAGSDAETPKVATLSAIFEGHRGANAEAMRSAYDIDKKVDRVNVRVQRVENVKSVEKNAQVIINGAQTVLSLLSPASLTSNHLIFQMET